MFVRAQTPISLPLANSVPLRVHRVTARMYVRAQTPISLPSDTEVARLLVIPTPPPSPLFISYYDPAESRDIIYFPSTTIEYTTIRDTTTPTYTFTYSITTYLLPPTDCRAGVSEVTLPPRKRLSIALGPRYEVGESSSAPTARPTRGFRADYRFVGTLNDENRRDLRKRQDTDEIYGRLDDAQYDRLLMSGQLNMLRRDRRAHASTARLMETKARLSREA
ncbi:hypothetical protein Tco_1414136 [Tanacetum coccineum]